MGSKCSCLSSTVTEEKVLTTERKMRYFIRASNYRQLEEQIQTISSVSSKKSACQVDLIKTIIMQSLLRGYIERCKARKTLISPISLRPSSLKLDLKKQLLLSTRQNSTDISSISRNLQEIPKDELPDYLSASTKALISTLTPQKRAANKKLRNKGPIYLENKAVYTGQWNKQKQRHGFGTQAWPDGSYYEGDWEFDCCSGFGRMVKSNGDFYEGHWNEDQCHGQGKLLSKNGSIYEGHWESGKKSGIGFELKKNESIYTGKFENDEKNGIGSIKLENGDKYDGEFCDGVFHGNGKYCWSDGRVYEGLWNRGLMHGFGTFCWSDGRVYCGEFVDGQKCGNGKFCWPDGRAYEGGWKADKQDGYGVYSTSMGVRTGYWKAGKRVHD